MQIMGTQKRWILGILAGLLCVMPAYADFGTHINVTISEVVYQETSFAENFTATEWQKTCYSEGIINVSNPNNETVFDIYISFTNTAGLSTNFTWDASTKFGNQTSGAPGGIIVVHIPELRQGNYSTFTYNISCMGKNPQVDINTTYTNLDHGHSNKVLAGKNWSVTQKIGNANTAGLNITNINITIVAQNVTWNTSLFSFSLESLDATGDFANVGNTASSVWWWWAPNGGELGPSDNVNISYTVKSPDSVPFTATYQALSENLQYQVNYLLSNLTIVDINASAEIDFDFDKQIVQPADNTESHNVTWQIDPYIRVPVNITYDLSLVTLWVTQDMNPTNDTGPTTWGRLETNYTPGSEINITTPWSGAGWLFNYTDGANSSYPPPIVWMDPQWLISHRYSQIVNFTQTRSGNDLYLKYIYVVHGYWLEIDKNITNIGEDLYQVDIYVQNIGNGWTPQYTYVTVYDFIPDDYASWDHSIACPGTQCTTQAISSGDYQGTAYRYNIPWKGTMNSSLGPKNGPDATTWQNYSWNVSYKVNGSGPYRVTELYVVGLDPLKVDGAFVSPIISIISGIQTYTNEIIYIAVILFLIIVNITNLVMTNRIHSKLQERLPPAPPAQPPHS